MRQDPNSDRNQLPAYVPKMTEQNTKIRPDSPLHSCLESAMASRTVYPDNQCFHECPLCNCRCNCADQPCSCCQENDKTAAEHLIETVQMIAQYLRGADQDGTAAVLETAIEKYRVEALGRCIACGNEVSGNFHFCPGKK